MVLEQMENIVLTVPTAFSARVTKMTLSLPTTKTIFTVMAFA